MKILIVDDSNVVREIVETALRHLGLELHDVMHAANGQQGIAALTLADTRGETLDLILCDVHMPVMNGLDFLMEKARLNLAPGVPVAMITAATTRPTGRLGVTTWQRIPVRQTVKPLSHTSALRKSV